MDLPRTFLHADNAEPSTSRLGIEAFAAVGNDHSDRVFLPPQFNSHTGGFAVANGVLNRFLQNTVEAKGDIGTQVAHIVVDKLNRQG